jgi:hypothetical protein
MTLSELNLLIVTTEWFSRLGEPCPEDAYVHISTLAPWANQPTNDKEVEEVADKMEWLPSSPEQDDPIHGGSLEERVQALGKKQEFAQKSLEVYRTMLASLRKSGSHPALKVGPHDFTEASRGAALFAVRRAAFEILLGEPGFWCKLMTIYHTGHWPCGMLPNKQIVVL